MVIIMLHIIGSQIAYLLIGLVLYIPWQGSYCLSFDQNKGSDPIHQAAMAFKPYAEMAPSLASRPITYPYQIDWQWKAGNSRSFGQMALFLPMAQDPYHVWYGSFIGMADTASAQEGNIGVGYRFIHKSRLLGWFMYYDMRHTQNDHLLHQWTIGGEWFGPHLEVRANAYVPLTKRRLLGSESIIQDKIEHHRHFIVQVDNRYYEVPLWGADLEVGGQIPSHAKLSVYLGYYFFGLRANVQPIHGSKFRLNYQLHPNLSLETECSYDTQRHWRGLVGARLVVRFGGKVHKSWSRLQRKMVQMPIRDVDIVSIEQGIRTRTPVVDTTLDDLVVIHVNHAQRIDNQAKHVILLDNNKTIGAEQINWNSYFQHIYWVAYEGQGKQKSIVKLSLGKFNAPDSQQVGIARQLVLQSRLMARFSSPMHRALTRIAFNQPPQVHVVADDIKNHSETIVSSKFEPLAMLGPKKIIKKATLAARQVATPVRYMMKKISKKKLKNALQEVKTGVDKKDKKRVKSSSHPYTIIENYDSTHTESLLERSGTSRQGQYIKPAALPVGQTEAMVDLLAKTPEHTLALDEDFVLLDR